MLDVRSFSFERPKSDRQAVPFPSTKMFDYVKDVLDESREVIGALKTYRFQISVYDIMVMKIYQTKRSLV